MISQRENALKELLEQSKGQLDFFNQKVMGRIGIDFRTETTEVSPSESEAHKRTMKSRRIINTQDSLVEVELDLSMIKA